ncbi:MAG TPA: sialidase family protein [Chitinophagaceae bacterium]|nr:sialidase family protein [Chitinophagaceae bacterium]
MSNLLFSLLLLILVSACENASNKTSDQTIDSSVGQAGMKEMMDSPADSVSAEPYLFTDKNGLVYLSWVEKTKEKSSLKFAELKNDQWSEPRVISSGDNWFVNWADYPLLAADGKNNLVAHFLEKSAKGTYTYDVKLTLSADQGKTWSQPKILHDDGIKAEHGFVSMIPYDDIYFVTWLDGRNAAMEGDGDHNGGHHGQMTIRAALVDKLGSKIKEWELDNRVCDCCQTTAALTANGPVVLYRDRSHNETRDISIVRYINGEWTSPKTIFPDNWKIEACPVNGPRADAIGNDLAVAWFTAPDKNNRVYIAFSGDGGANFNSPIRIDEGKPIGRVDLLMLDSTTALVSWMEGPVIKVIKVSKDGRKESSQIVAISSESRSSGFPQMTKSGNAIIFAWTDTKEKRIKVGRLSLQ